MSSQIRSKFQFSPFHLVENSPWPITVSFALLAFLNNGILSMQYYCPLWVVLLSFLATVGSILFWVRDVISEGSYLGSHTLVVKKGLNSGFLLFIVSESFLFIAFIWGYLHSSLAPTVELGMEWPPMNIEAIGPLELPLLNTVLLLSSGVSCTAAHHYFINGSRSNALLYLMITIAFGVVFLFCQYLEYTGASFTIADGVYGSVFYSITGLHMFHVIIGVLFLSASLWRMYASQMTRQHHLWLELSIIYWHFVDVVWLFVYILCYVYGS